MATPEGRVQGSEFINVLRCFAFLNAAGGVFVAMMVYHLGEAPIWPITPDMATCVAVVVLIQSLLWTTILLVFCCIADGVLATYSEAATTSRLTEDIRTELRLLRGDIRRGIEAQDE
jgi:hypothetical protein